jgi:tetratricopeptide (TPR) repeat protein
MREYWKILVLVIIYQFTGTEMQAQMLSPEKEQERIQLLKDVNKIKKDTNYVVLCYKYGLFYEGIRNDSAVYYYERARDISEEIGYINGQIRYYDYRSMVYIIESNYDTALMLMDTAYKMAKDRAGQQDSSAGVDPQKILEMQYNLKKGGPVYVMGDNVFPFMFY